MFKVQFPNWDDQFSKQWITKGMLDQMMKEHGSGGNSTDDSKQEETKDQFGNYKDPETHKISYADLKGIFPEGIKPDRKEMYLDEKEF